MSKEDLVTTVRDEVAAVLGVNPTELPIGTAFVDLGLNSAGAVRLSAALARRMGREIPGWLVWRHPSIKRLAAGLAGDIPPVAAEQSVQPGATSEPVAVVGIGCRLPGGVGDPEGFWTLLTEGRDVVSEVPAARWDVDEWSGGPQEPGRSSTRWGGFLDDISAFDAAHFRLSPAEAEAMDPQQRLVLETTWSALEDAGCPPLSLSGSRTGVFLGSMFSEYGAATGRVAADTVSHNATGEDGSIIPARVAYTLGLRGPVLGLQTACSSSLTAIHLAARSLSDGESDLALAGGVNVLLDPHTTVAMTAFGAMSPTGRSRAFGAGADGYVRAEGCGVVVLRRLTDALAAGDRIYAVIEGSAVNGDGASNGLTAPSPEAQEAVLREAWAQAGINPCDVGYVEAHGTGTLLGDPIEAGALGSVLGTGRPADAPLAIGSVKANLGHLEPAAGVVGLIKAVLCLHHGHLVPSLHSAEPNPHLDLVRSGLRVVQQVEPWLGAGRRLAGVSSFGFGGSNAHVALAEAPVRNEALAVLAGPAPNLMSAPSVGGTRRPRVVLALPGHGAQWPGMSRDLLSLPLVADTLLRVESVSGVPLRRLLAAGTPLRATREVQPLLFGLQVATGLVLEAHGLRPDVVLGQSVGEVAAAVLSGALSLDEGSRVVAAWSAAVGDGLDGQGTVRVISLGRSAVEELVSATGVDVTISAVLSDDRTCVAGTTSDLDALVSAAPSVPVHDVDIDYPAHGRRCAEVVDAVRAGLGRIAARPTVVPMVSTVTGEVVSGEDLHAGYWIENTLRPALVGPALAAVRELTGQDPLVVVEVSPQRVLAGLLGRGLGASGTVAGVVTTGHREMPAAEALEAALADLGDLGVLEPAADRPAGLLTVPVSGATPAALRENAARVAAAVEAAPEDVDNMVRDLTVHRSALRHRAVVVASDPDRAVSALQRLARGADGPGILTGSPSEGALALLFTGQGSQRVGMGGRLAAHDPGFADHYLRVIEALDEHLDRPLGPVLDGVVDDAGSPLLHRTQYTQPALFALEVSLHHWWQDVGLRPDFLVGHSVGELAAAHTAGILTLEDASRLVVARGALMDACRADGVMVSVEADEAEVRHVLTGREDRASVAGLNGPTQTVVSGDAEVVLAVAEHFAAAGRRTRRLEVSHAFHSPHMEEALEGLRAVAASCASQPGHVPVLSTRTDEWLDGGQDLTEHWVRQVREPVRFLDAMHVLEKQGTTQYLELGPAPVLSAMAAGCLAAEPAGGLVACMHPELDEPAALAEAVARLHVAGRPLDWQRMTRPARTRHGAPLSAFDRKVHWATGGGFPARAALRVHALWSAVDEGSVDDLATVLDIAPADKVALGSVLPHLRAFRRDLRAAPGDGGRALEDVWVQADEPSGKLAGRWIVVSPAGPERTTTAEALRRAGAATVEELAVPDALQLGVLADPSVAGVLALLLPRGGQFDGGAIDGAPHALDAVRMAQAASIAASGPPIWCLTRDGVVTGVGESAETPDLAAAATWGLAQVAALETDGRWRGTVDIVSQLDDHLADRVAAMIGANSEEHVALRGETTLVRRLRTTPANTGGPELAGPVLVTGAGAISGHLVRWLAERGVRDVVVLSRSGSTPEVSASTTVHPRACDVTDADAVRKLVRELRAEGLAPATVVHAAGVLADRMLPDVDTASLAAVCRPKVDGALALVEATADLAPVELVLVTSVVGVLGNTGQAAYAMANAALDTLAAGARATGRRAVSVAFGPWDGPGMAAGAIGDGFRRRGLQPMSRRRALRGLEEALAAGRSRVVIDVAWPTAASEYHVGENRGLLRYIPSARAQAKAVDPDGLRAALAALAPPARAARLVEVARAVVAEVLRAEPSEVDLDRGLGDHGVDSMMAVAISQRLTRSTGVPTTRTIAFDQPTVRRLASWLDAQLSNAAGEANAPIAGATVAPDDDPVVIVGAGLRMPGGAHDLDSLWDVLASGRDTVGEVPLERLGSSVLHEAGSDGPFVRLASLVDDVEGFDAAFFGITPREAQAMDPQQRLLLESTWEALESAGLRPETLQDTTTGVFVGCAGAEYAAGAQPEGQDVYSLTGRLTSFTAGRIAYHLGTQGPTYAIDTACSSSLVALHVATESLRRGECDVALAGGVQVIADPGMFVALSRAGALSSDGRSRTFSADADGYGRGEGAGVVALMRLSAARSGGHPVLGVVLGSAVMHDGASSGITAPNGTSQERVVRSALERAGIGASTVDYVECHGTGTPLGDPIEVNALAAAYDQPGREPLLIGTAKPVIGHLEAAAGIAGICKVIASFRHDALPPTPYTSPRNPYVAWDELPVEVVDVTTPWPYDATRPRRAGISAFGLSGTNAHVVLEQPPATAKQLAAAAAAVGAPVSESVSVAKGVDE